MTYLPDLEVLWKQNAKKTNTGSKRRSGPLRGPAVIRALLHSYLATGDEIFKAAVEALLKHGIIDHKGNLTSALPPFAQAIQLQLDRKNILSIRRRIEGGQTLQRACAETAAEMGHQANSFAAAIKDLKNRYKRNPDCELPNFDALKREVDSFKEEYDRRLDRIPRALLAFDEILMAIREIEDRKRKHGKMV
jgi:hypothetical protein